MGLPSNPYNSYQQKLAQFITFDNNGYMIIASPTGDPASVYVGPGNAGVAIGNAFVDLSNNQDLSMSGQNVDIGSGQLKLAGLSAADPTVATVVYSDGAPAAGVPKAIKISGG